MSLLVDAIYVFRGRPALQRLLSMHVLNDRDTTAFFMEIRVWSNHEDGISYDVGAVKLLFVMEMHAIAVENGLPLAEHLSLKEATFDEYWTVERHSGVDSSAREVLQRLVARAALGHVDTSTQERLRRAVRMYS